MSNNALRRLILGVPTALPLAAVVGCILGGMAWIAVAVAAGLALWARTRRIAAGVVLCALVSALHLALLERHADILRSLPLSDTPVLEGTVTRVLRGSLLLRPAGICPEVQLRGVERARCGDRLRVRLFPAAEEPPPPVPGMFDAAAWRRSRGIALVAEAGEVEYLGHPMSFDAVRGAALHGRAMIARRLMPPERAADPRRQVLCALVLGATEEAEEETMAIFRRSGCLHLFAVSGMHVGIVFGLCYTLFARMRVHPRTARPLILLLVGLYVLVTGCAVSALRAYLMLAVVMGGLMLRRRVSLANTWCAAALIVLLLHPHELCNAGFLLSFGVYAAIVIIGGIALRRDTPWFGPDAYLPFRVRSEWELRWQATERWLRCLFVVSPAAWLISAPLTVCFFHSITPWSFLTNILMTVPVILALSCGIFLLLCGGIPVVGSAAAWCADTAAGLLLSVAGAAASLPGAYLPATYPRPPEAVAVYETGYGKSCCVLGNPGIVLFPGSAYQARRISAPALFHAGFSPVLLVEENGRTECLTAMADYWPRIRRAESQHPMVYTTSAGRYTLYPPPADLPPVPAQNRLPVILWEHAGSRTLYVGDASSATVATIPPEQRHADTLILGAHPLLPFGDADDIAEFGAREIQYLPSARKQRAELESYALPPED